MGSESITQIAQTRDGAELSTENYNMQNVTISRGYESREIIESAAFHLIWL